MTGAIVAVFALACLAPWLPRLLRGWTGWITALVPSGVAVLLVANLPGIAAGETLREVQAWVPALGLNLSFFLDGLSLAFALLISGIGALILIYVGKYLAGHPHIGRFYAFILLFMGSMLGLVLADNLLTLFIFWELTSFSSYLLIGFENQKPEARSAALEALLVTSLGGLVLLVGFLLVGQAGGTFELSELLSRPDALRGHELYAPILVSVLIGVFTKSAQFPFHFWLPSAMAAPTPASAYLHSATMVKAGVYLMARVHPLLGGTEAWETTVTAVGALTAVVGAYLALRETHLKRLLAYTTVSSLGILTMLLGLGTPLAIQAAMTFLVAHALYKAALFLVAGAVDHEAGERDVERLGGLVRDMPVTASAAGLAALSMAGMFPLLGFVSKELLFEATLNGPSWAALLTTAALMASTCIVTVAILVGLKPFFGKEVETPRRPHGEPVGLWLGAMLLALLGLVFGVAPERIAGPLVRPAASAALADSTAAPLALWHGWTLALALDLVAVVGGVVVYLRRATVRRSLARLEPAAALGPARWYRLGLDALTTTARGQTRVLQSGYLRYYLLATIITTVALVASILLARPEGFPATIDVSDARYYEVGLAVILLSATVVVVRSRSRLAAIAAMGVVGYGVGLIFVFFGAPDLAITQFTIETLTVILFVLVFYHLPRFENRSSRLTRICDAGVATAAGGLMTLLVMVASNVEWQPPISDYFAENSTTLAHGRNIVNVILVDFRGIDTLGEISVLAVAGIGVYVLLRLRLNGNAGVEK